MKKARKKRKKYKTGIHHSPKCAKPIKYRSGWEKSCIDFFDYNDNIIKYDYEPFAISYVANTKINKIRKYYPDFLIELKDGTKKIIEVKPKSKLCDQKVIKKSIAAQIWCKANGYIYEFWTDDIIKQLEKINKINLITLKD